MEGGGDGWLVRERETEGSRLSNSTQDSSPLGSEGPSRRGVTNDDTLSSGQTMFAT